MSSYAPPRENVAIFDTLYFTAGDEFITQSQADKRYLRFPNAQGTENLQAINVGGVATFNSTSTFKANSTFEGTADIIQQSGSQLLQQPASTSFFSAGNALNQTSVRTDFGSSLFPAVQVIDSVADTQLYILPNANNNAYNPIVNAGDVAIISNTSTGPAPLVLSTGTTTTTNGIRIDQSQLSMGYGGSGDIPTNNLIMNATDTSLSKPLIMTGAVNTDRLINNIYYQLQDEGSLTTTTGEIYANGSVFNYDNNINGGSHNFAVNTAGGVQVIPFNTSSALTTINSTNITLTSPNPPTSSATQPVASDSSTKMPTTAWTQGAIDAKIPTSLLGLNNTWTGTNDFINTGTGSLTSSAVQPVASDSSTKIPTTAWVQSAISAIPPPSSQFQPVYHTLADYQTGTSGYSQGAYINWSGGWGALDYVIIRIRAQGNWSINSGEYNSYATTAGELIIRPHYATAGVMGSLGPPNQFWSTNSGSLFGNVKKLLYYTGAVNDGTQSYFFIYGNGGSGGGASGYIQLMFEAPGTAGGWQYTCSYEYMLHSVSGASITFTNGPGGGTTTNNSLP
jgi:hypothetical protein